MESNVAHLGCSLLLKFARVVQKRKEILQLDGIQIIVEAMLLDPNRRDVQHEGIGALINLAKLVASHRSIAEKGGILAIVKAMEHHRHDAKIQQRGCIAFLNLSANTNSQEQFFPSYGSTLWSKSILQKTSSSSSQSLLAGNGGIDAIIQAMKTHVGDSSVQLYGFSALMNLAVDRSNQQFITNRDGIRTMITAMRALANDRIVQKRGCDTFIQLAFDKYNRKSIIENEGVETIMHAMHVHKDDECIQTACCQALFFLGKDQDHVKQVGYKIAQGAIDAAMNPRNQGNLVDVMNSAVENMEGLVEGMMNLLPSKRSPV